MGIFCELKKLNYILTSNDKIDPKFFYWDIRKKRFVFVGEIVAELVDVKYDKRLQKDIVAFLNIEKEDQLLNLIFVLTKNEAIPNQFVKSREEMIKEINVLEHRVPFTEPEYNVKLTEQYDSFFAISSETFILTKRNCRSLIFRKLNELPREISVTYMRYRNNWRFSTNRKYFVEKKDSETDVLQIEFELNSRLACMCFSKGNLTKFIFSNISSSLQNQIVSIFDRFQIIAETKRNIKIKYVPKPGINKSYMIPLRDLIMVGKFSRYLITLETDKPLEQKKRTSFIFAGYKITVSKSDITDELFFKISDSLSFVDFVYFTVFFKEFLQEFREKTQEIVDSYQMNVKSLFIIETKRVKKTKKLIDDLRDAEPTIFSDVYTQDCQYQRQPYIIGGIDEFKEKLDSMLGKEKLENFLKEKQIESKKNLTIKDFLLEFPTSEYEDLYPLATKRYYACIGRQDMDYRKYPFPLIQKKVVETTDITPNKDVSKTVEEFLEKREEVKEEIRGAPCCFQKLHEEKQTVTNKSHMLTSMKTVPPERKGILQNYINSFDHNYYRYGIENFRSFIERIKPITDVKFQDFKLTAESLHFWSYCLNVAIILYETISKYNSLVFRIVPSNIDLTKKSFVFFTKNASFTYEQIKTKTKFIHNDKDIISRYAKTAFLLMENEKLIRKN